MSDKQLSLFNKVTISEVIKGVLLQQFFQTIFGLLIIVVDDEDALIDDTLEILKYQKSLDLFVDKFESLKFAIKPFGNIIIELLYWYLFPLLRFAFAMILLDTWQYFMHRYFHQNTFLYRHIHSLHHKLYAPYAFGALYNHPIEGFIMDTVGAGLSFKISGLSTRGGMLFFGFATLKTVDDHCGYALPFNPIQKIFGNNSAYHDIHHQVYGIKMNYSQPFFTFWDRILGTYMPCSINANTNNTTNITTKIYNNNHNNNKKNLYNNQCITNFIDDDTNNIKIIKKDNNLIVTKTPTKTSTINNIIDNDSSLKIKYNLRTRKIISKIN
ncbi:1392_t:CDS:2 [Entrophospora sp. SA101]|nr:17190_t:CDS:2 [Entrophospora sp. SA101]CAJ0769287.1 1392_t:CDS:2 [Entrophospora sp. SA101]